MHARILRACMANVLSSMNEFAIRSGPCAGLEIASLHTSIPGEAKVTAHYLVRRITPASTADST
jgi:hypothetical protein